MSNISPEENLLNEKDEITEILYIQKYIKNNQEEHLKAVLAISATELSIPKLKKCDTYCGPKLDYSLLVPFAVELESTMIQCTNLEYEKIKK
jgi:hypothetical protein